jgi:hypothetical protein
MFPGLTTRLSEGVANPSVTGVLTPKTDYVRIGSTASSTAIATITPAYEGFSGVMFVHNSSGGNVTTVTTGNILTAITIGSNALVLFVYSKQLAKWVVGALA